MRKLLLLIVSIGLSFPLLAQRTSDPDSTTNYYENNQYEKPGDRYLDTGYEQRRMINQDYGNNDYERGQKRIEAREYESPNNRYIKPH